MPKDEEIFNGMPTVHMLIELPTQVYAGMKQGYDQGIESGLHNNSLERWTGLIVCKGIDAIYQEQKQQNEELQRQINFVPNDAFVDWLQSRIEGTASSIASLAYKETLDRYISYGRL